MKWPSNDPLTFDCGCPDSNCCHGKRRDAPLYEWTQEKSVFTATTGQWLLIIYDDEEGAWNDPESRFSWSLRIRHRISSIFTDVDGGFCPFLEEAQEEVTEAFHKVCNP